jgi:hypothetical protein
MQEKQASFAFADESRGPPRAEPLPKLKVRRQGSSICNYCGRRMPSALLDRTPQVSDDAGWLAITPYHARDCRWIATKGLRECP